MEIATGHCPWPNTTDIVGGSLFISDNGFGISEVAGGISERSGEIPKGNFAYSVLCEVASGASEEQNRNYFRSRYAEKE